MPQIRDALVEQNPWWKGDFELDYRDREVYTEVKRFMRLPQIVALTGLRRAGKTTLMLKAAKDAMADGLDPRNVLYFSFDEFKEADIREVLREYEAVVDRDLRTGPFLVLLDEIQKLEGWEDQLKAQYDARKKNVRFVISGSESLFIREKSAETLAGRLFEFRVDPLTFREYLAFRGVEYRPVRLYERELVKLFDDFVATQGFPELVSVRDKAVIRKYLRDSIVEKVVIRDLPGLLGIRNVSTIQSLLNILMEEPGQLIEISELSGTLGISRRTLSSYLAYLERSFLVRKLYNYSRSRRKVERKLRKYYPVIVSTALAFSSENLARSRFFEWAVVNQLRAEFFWRDPYRHEVDIVLGERTPVPVEVKHGRLDTDGLRFFMNKFNVRKGYVVTPDREEKRKLNGKDLFIVPAFKALLEPHTFVA